MLSLKSCLRLLYGVFFKCLNAELGKETEKAISGLEKLLFYPTLHFSHILTAHWGKTCMCNNLSVLSVPLEGNVCMKARREDLAYQSTGENGG